MKNPTPTIVLFQNENYGGEALVIRDFSENLGHEGFNDKTSSAIVISGTWTLYQDYNYGGQAWGPLTSDGGPSQNGLYPNWDDWHGKNDSVSSVQGFPGND